MALRNTCRRIAASNARATVSFSLLKSHLSTDPSPAQDPPASGYDANTTNSGESSSAFDFPRPKPAPVDNTMRTKVTNGITVKDSVSSSAKGSNAATEESSKGANNKGQQETPNLAERNGEATKNEKRVDKDEEYVVDELGTRRKRQLVEVEKGHFHEFTAVNQNKGKFFLASNELIPPDEAIYFPKLSATALTGQSVKFPACFKNRVTLVGAFHRQFGFTMLPTWVEPLEEAFGGSALAYEPRPEVPAVLQLSLLESWALRVLKPVMVMSMGRDLSPDRKETFCYRFGDTDELRKTLGIKNRLTLDVLLVDQMGRIRWRASGKSTPGEVDSLISCTRQLMKEGNSGASASSGAEIARRRGRRGAHG